MVFFVLLRRLRLERNGKGMENGEWGMDSEDVCVCVCLFIHFEYTVDHTLPASLSLTL